MFFSICRRYEEMADRVSDIPETTEALVELQNYLREVDMVCCVFCIDLPE